MPFRRTQCGTSFPVLAFRLSTVSEGEDRSKEGEDRSKARGIPEGLREAIEGAFVATGRTRDRASELSEKTLDRAQGLVDEVARRGQEARGTLEGMRLTSRDELKQIEDRLEELSRRVDQLERGSTQEPGS